MTFPLFEYLIGILLNKLISHGFLVHRLKNYKNEFQASGFESLDILQRVMMKCIPCEVKELQGHKVTLER